MTPWRNEKTARVLVIEADKVQGEALVNYLRMEGMEGHAVNYLADAQMWMGQNHFDVVLLDCKLPDGDGVSWLRKQDTLRSKGVIILSAQGDSFSRVSGIRAGADVYLIKPVLPEELIALVHNLMRRIQVHAPVTWILDDMAWRIFAPDGRGLKLTHFENMLLRRLAVSSGKAVSREELAISLGCQPEHYDYRRLEILIRRLRNKAKKEWDLPLPVETAHRQGYAFTANIRVGLQ